MWGKVSRSAAVCETLGPAARLGSTNNHQSSKSLRCPSIARLMLTLNFCRSSSTMFTCMNALGCCWARVIGWWAICVDKLLNIVTNKVVLQWVWLGSISHCDTKTQMTQTKMINTWIGISVFLFFVLNLLFVLTHFTVDCEWHRSSLSCSKMIWERLKC